ncbi:Putative ribosome biogenesis protein [Sparassis crispa]|uniref:Ribosome biogenesis protein n=1 Tax=Sparassis crispa TaxID=139825 RepID=A0A401GS82_9APHY|nr:Putative ribosome biogenesis protein [Sparassis crispa]GBE85077.1 Putative ribosome biogenesis protein [Sparassis crispa]
MSKATLIDDHVSATQSKKAVDALLTHMLKVEEKKADNELLPGKEQNIWLVVTTKQMYPEKKLKPSKIPLAHPIIDPRTSPVCLITKDPQREYKDLLESHNIRFISRVVGITKLKGKFKPFEARRLLLKENGLFLADERVVPLLPKLLGKMFFEAKKQPIPVCLTRKDLKGELERAISSTYFHQNQGTCVSIKIGTLSQKPAHVLENLMIALPAVVKNIKGSWDNIQSFHIKTNSSASLPIWTCNLGSEEGSRWGGLIVSTEPDEEREDAEGKKVRSVETEGKKRKRAPLEEEERMAKAKIRTKKDQVAEPEKERVTAAKGVEGEKPKKKAKVDDPEEDEDQVVATTLSSTLKEVRFKRGVEGLEKKKVKMVKAKPGTKSAKAAVLGKRKV